MPEMKPVALAILAVLFTFQAQATETFDTHFLMGGMKDKKVTHFQLDPNKPILVIMSWISMLISNGGGNIMSILLTNPLKPVCQQKL